MKLNKLPTTISAYTQTCKTIVLAVLMLLIIVSLIVYTLQLAYILVTNVFAPPIGLMPSQVTELFSEFLLVLVGFGLVETVRAFFKDSIVHVEIVFMVAMIGVARKAMLLDLNALNPVTLIGLGVVILGLSIGYFLIKRIFEANETTSQ